MCYFIGIADLVANALIELVEKTGKRTIPLSKLSEYGDAVVAKLRKENTEVILIYSRDETDRFFHDCSDVFSVKEEDDDVLITLNDNVSTQYLRRRFRINIALNLLSAFVSQDVLSSILDVTT